MHREQGEGLAPQTVLLTALAMLAFAGNSLLCRLALKQGIIDPASFASLRLVSGALTLALIVRLRSGQLSLGRGDWLAVGALFAYAACFSFAYLSLSAGTGALILFGSVQLTMFGEGLRKGERFALIAWFGLSLALAGLLYLLLPGVTAPPPLGAALMALAGIGWGIYSLRGRGIVDPLVATASNFARTAPFTLALNLLLFAKAHANATGVALAIASGAITSGLGYVIWYAALKRLSATKAATVQLCVPLVAAFGGAVLLSETITLRLVIASAAILGGIAWVLSSKTRKLAVHRRP